MHVKSVESSNVLLLVWGGSDPGTVDLTDEVPNRSNFLETENCVHITGFKTLDGFHNSKEHPPNVTTSHPINESKDIYKTLKCVFQTNNRTDKVPNRADFLETEDSMYTAKNETLDGFNDSKEKESLNYKLHCGTDAYNNLKKSDGVLCTQQHQSVKTHKKNPYSSLNTFKKTYLKFSRAHRMKQIYKKCVNKKNTEIKEGNNQPLEETYSKILNKVQVNRDKKKSTLNQNSIKEINHDVGNKASTDPNWLLGDEKNYVSFYSKTSISSNCIEDTIGNNEQSFNSFPCSSHWNRHSHLLQSEEKDNTSFHAYNGRKNKISEPLSSSNFIKYSVPSKEKNDHDMFVSNIVKDLDKSFEDCISMIEKNNQIKKYEPRDDSPRIFQKSMCRCNKCWYLQKMGHKKLTYTELFHEHLAQLKPYKPLSKCEAVSSTNFTSEKSFENSKQDSKLSEMIPDLNPCNVLIDQLSSNELIGAKNLKISGKTCKGNYFNKDKKIFLNNANKSLNDSTNKKYLKHCHVLLKRLNLKEFNLSENRACSANEKNQRYLDILKYANSSTHANVLKNYSNLKDIAKCFRKRPKLNRDSMSLPSGSSKVNISGNTFKFHSMSVANAKKTVCSHSIHNGKKGCFSSEDLQNTKCTSKYAYKNQNLIIKKPVRVLSCVQCHDIFPTNKQYYNHLCLGKRKVGYLCDICEKILKTTTKYAVHVKDHFLLL
ncbi:hypothetical protein TNCV_1163901 [Trichonephila clavipes]|nr:hypothetical protein TNCV_1163901 [Trichonephila clavipes]